MLNDIIKFKVHIQKNLEDYEGFVVDEVEHELGGDDEIGDDTPDVEMSQMSCVYDTLTCIWNYSWSWRGKEAL